MKNTDFAFPQPSDSTGFLLWQVTNLWQREIKKALESLGLTHAQFVLLASIHWLTRQNQEITQVVLSNHTGVDVMTTSSILRTLETRKFIERREHSIDTRAKTVVLTSLGLKVVKKAIKRVEEFDGLFFGALKRERSIFNRNLSQLLQYGGEAQQE